jgi:type I restriction enzyme S subunit
VSPEALLRQFDAMAEAPNGAQKLRELILQLAVRGKLVPQEPSEEPASALLERARHEKLELMRRGEVRDRKLPPLNHDDLPYDLPNSWVWARLDDIGRELKQKVPDRTFTYIDVSSIESARGIVSEAVRVLEAKDAPSRARKLVRPGAVIYSTVRPYLLNIAIIDRPFTPEPVVSTAFAVLDPLASVEARYLFYYLRSASFVEYVQREMTGMAYPAINDAKFFGGPVPVPPLDEQRRIVAKVDKLMSLCDELEAGQQRRVESRARLNRSLLHHFTAARDDAELAAQWQRLRANFGLLYDTPETVAQLRLLFVDLAVQGRLLRDSTHSILDVANSERLEDDGAFPPIPAHWRWERIADLGADPANPVQTGPFGAQLHKSEFVQSGVPVIAVGNLTGRGFKTDGLYYISSGKADTLARYDVRSGDLLFARSGATLGKVCVAPDYVDDWRMTGHLLRVRLNQSVANPHFLVYALWGAAVVREQVMAGIQGTTRPGYNTSLLERIVVPVPPRLEQDRLVEKLDELMALCDRLETKLTAARDQAGYLAASVVHHLTAA